MAKQQQSRMVFFLSIRNDPFFPIGVQPLNHHHHRYHMINSTVQTHVSALSNDACRVYTREQHILFVNDSLAITQFVIPVPKSILYARIAKDYDDFATTVQILSHTVAFANESQTNHSNDTSPLLVPLTSSMSVIRLDLQALQDASVSNAFYLVVEWTAPISNASLYVNVYYSFRGSLWSVIDVHYMLHNLIRYSVAKSHFAQINVWQWTVTFESPVRSSSTVSEESFCTVPWIMQVSGRAQNISVTNHTLLLQQQQRMYTNSHNNQSAIETTTAMKQTIINDVCIGRIGIFANQVQLNQEDFYWVIEVPMQQENCTGSSFVHVIPDSHITWIMIVGIVVMGIGVVYMILFTCIAGACVCVSECKRQSPETFLWQKNHGNLTFLKPVYAPTLNQQTPAIQEVYTRYNGHSMNTIYKVENV